MVNIIHLNILLGIMIMVIKPLYLELSQLTGYINKFNEHKNKKNKNTITMSLKVKDKKLFKNYHKIWKKLKN